MIYNHIDQYRLLNLERDGYMKKSILICICLIISLLCGCSNQSNIGNSPAESIAANPVGTYTDVSFSDTGSVYVDFAVQSEGREREKETIVITATDNGYSFEDSLHSGRLTDNGDGNFTAKKERVITEDPLIIKLAELELERDPYAFYVVYENYLIKKSPIDGDIVGELPSEEKKTTCFISIEHLTYSTYTLSFSADGSCDIMTIFNGDICSCSGTYSVKGKIISLTFTKGDFYGEELSGNIEMAFYVEDNTLYDQVYHRK